MLNLCRVLIFMVMVTSLPQQVGAEERLPTVSNQTLLDLLGTPVLEGPYTISIISEKAVECVKQMAWLEAGPIVAPLDFVENCRVRLQQLIDNPTRNTGGFSVDDFSDLEMYYNVVAADEAAMVPYRAELTTERLAQFHFVDSDFWRDGPSETVWWIAPPN